MKKDKLLCFKKTTFLFLLLIVLPIQITYSQCTNSVPTGDTTQYFCKTDNSTIGDLVAFGGEIAWYDASSGGNLYSTSSLLFNGATYYADDVENDGCSTSRLEVVVVISGYAPTNVDVYVGKCASENPTIADLNATGTNIEWYDAQTGGNLLPATTILDDGSTYWVQQTENGCESTRLPTTITLIDPTPPEVETTQSFCYPPNPTIADLQPSGTDIIWYEDEASTIALDSSTSLIDGKSYWASTDSFPCESTIRVQTTVVLDTPANAGTDGALTECELNVTTTNLFSLLGDTPDINGTWTGPSELTNGYFGTYDPTTNIEGTYTYTVATELAICPEETAVVVVDIIETLPPTTTEENQSFCEIDSPTIDDLDITGNKIIWYDTETSTTSLTSSDALVDGEDYWASQTDTTGCESASRQVVNVTIAKPAMPTTSSQSQAFCSTDNATIASLDITGENITWYDTETSTTPLDSADILIDGEDYWASQTEASGCESANRLYINVTVTTPVKPTTISADQFFCEIENKTIADLEIDGTGIIWYDTETSTTPLDTTDILDNGDYWASQTVGTSCESTDRLAINVTISKPVMPTTSASNQTFCIGDYTPNTPTIADIDVTGTGIVWYDTETSTTPLDSTDVLINGEDYWAVQTDPSSECESADRLVITVTVSNPATPTTSSQSQTFCSADNATIASIDITGENIVWYDTETSTTPLDINDLLVDGEDYWAAASDATTGCESINRYMVTSSITDVLPPTVSVTDQSFCAADLPTIANLSITGNGIVWYATQLDTTPLDSTELLIDGEDYWAAQTTTTSSCESSVRASVNVTVFDAGTPLIITTGNEFCKIDEPTLSNLNENVTAVNGGTITWYDSYPDGTELSLTELLEDDVTYYAIETNTNNCVSLNPLEVTVTLDACDEYDIVIYDGFSPTGNGINDTFKIGNLRELYPNFTVDFYNRWGNLVYTANAAKSDWNGKLNGNDELVPSGVYYFIIHFNKEGKKPIQRRLYLSR